MSERIESPSFEQALLRTERLRVLGAIVIIFIFGAASGVRIFVFGSHMSPLSVYGSAVAIVYELLVLTGVQRSIKSGPVIPDWFWTVNVIIEMAMPALGVAFFVSDRVPVDFRPLATPWVLLFFPFLILSTLRLSWVVSSVAGFTGAIGYLLAAEHHGWHFKSDLLSNQAAHTAVPFFAVMIFSSGVIAAVIAHEIRSHVQAALREAETQRQLKQMEHDLTIARSIQQSLLPKVRPKVDGYEIAGWNRSADATGGDYFDWKQLEDGRLVVTLADVTGHGIGPALLASVCRAYARASFGDIQSLPHTLQRINQSFGEDLSPGRFATFVAAVCKPGDDTIELLSAGHAPLFWFSSATGKLQAYDAHDVPLGILPRLTADSSQVLHLSEGDIVFLVTDGFLEWENASGDDFGVGRFEKFVQTHCQLPPEEIIAELYQAVLQFAGGTKQMDDLTAVVIKKTSTSTGLEAAQAVTAGEERA